MKTSVYVDTSVIGGCFDPEFKEWSRGLLDQFKEGTKQIVLSDLTFKELEDAPEPIISLIAEIPESYQKRVELTEEARGLAQHYIDENALSKNHLVDAQHIAIATLCKVDLVVSWNFKHIVHFDKIRKFNAVNLKLGFSTLEIRSPKEVV